MGLTDADAAALPTPLDADTLGRLEMSTWRTHAGDFDILTDLPTRDGRRLRFDELIGRALVQDIPGVAVHVAAMEDVIRVEGVGRPAEGPAGAARVAGTGLLPPHRWAQSRRPR